MWRMGSSDALRATGSAGTDWRPVLCPRDGGGAGGPRMRSVFHECVLCFTVTGVGFRAVGLPVVFVGRCTWAGLFRGR